MKAHPFFKSIKFALLRHMTPPIVPNTTTTTSNNFTYRPHYKRKDSGSLDLDAEDESVMVSELSIPSQDPFAKFNSSNVYYYSCAYVVGQSF